MSDTPFYDEYWRDGLGDWSARCPPPTARERDLLARFAAPGQSLLDIGCGDGKVARLLQPRGITCHGLDVSAEAVDLCRQQGFTAAVHDLTQPLPFPDAQFDTVTIFEVLEHLLWPQEAVRELARVLKPGGHLVGSVPNAVCLGNRLLMAAGRFNPGGSPATSLAAPWRDPHVRFFAPRSLRAMLAETPGLTVTGLWGSPFALTDLPVLYRTRGPLRRLLDLAARPLGWLGRLGPSLWSHRLYFAARRS